MNAMELERFLPTQSTTSAASNDEQQRWPELPEDIENRALTVNECLQILSISNRARHRTTSEGGGAEEEAQRAKEERDYEKLIKCQYRKLCLKYHPDKCAREREREAAKAFTAITAAYHTLTTQNFNQKLWMRQFRIPPMQSIEDVLKIALTPGADMDEVERMMQIRGEYRPHERFGIDYNVRWESGSKKDVSSFTDGGMFREREMNEYADTRAISEGFEGMKVGADVQARPWETVGGVGYDDSRAHHKRKFSERQMLNNFSSSSLNVEHFKPLSREAKVEAERLNDLALEEYEKCRYDDAMIIFDAIIEKLMPETVAYRNNRASCALKLIARLENCSINTSSNETEKYRREELIRKTIMDCTKALEIDSNSNEKAKVRLGEAYVKSGDLFENTKDLLKAKKMFDEVLSNNPNNKRAKNGLKDCLLSLELCSDYGSEDEDDDKMMN